MLLFLSPNINAGIGKVTEQTGNASITREKTTLESKKDSSVESMDIIETANSIVGISFEDDTQVKVTNMLSGHAILYISREYKEAIIELLKNNTLYYNDVLFSRLQPKFTVLANKKPVFYQSSRFNSGMHQENWTKFEINI